MVIPSLGLLNASVSQDINSSQDELREGRKAGRQIIFSLGQEINHQELNWFGFCLWCPFVTRTQCSCYIWIWQEKSWLKKSYHTCMMEDERKDKGDLERGQSPVSQQSASFHQVYHPTSTASACSPGGRGECPWESVAFQGKKIIGSVLSAVDLVFPWVE